MYGIRSKTQANNVSTSLYVSFLLPLYVNICIYFNKLKKIFDI